MSLSRTTFTWYTNLPANSIQTWAEMERQFHSQFYRTVPEVTVADLTRMYQYNTEIVDQFISHFKKSRNRCLTILTENEFTNLAFNGLRFNLKERFEGQAFDNLFQLNARVSKYEHLLKEKDKKPNRDNWQAVAFAESAEYVQIIEEENEIAVATMVLNKPYVCLALKPAG